MTFYSEKMYVFFKLFILQFQKAIEWKAFFFETMETLLIKTWN